MAHGQHSHGQHGNPEDLDAYIAKMEAPDRAAWQKPDEVIKALGLKPGQTACDLGTGPAYFALKLAKVAGHVYAEDVEPRILEVARQRIAAAGARNITPVLGLPDDPLLPDASCDVVLIVDTFHHFPDGTAYLKRVSRLLKPGGRLANIDFHKRETPVGPPVEHRVARETFLEHATQAGLKVVSEPTMLPYQYFLVLQPK
jgi:ubiquinone/menaquinone biosynthesis C-methylase UbiE